MTAGISPHSFFSFFFFLFFFLFPTSRLSVLLALNPTQKRRRPPPPRPLFFGLSAKGGAGGAEKEKLNGAIRKARAVLLRAVPFGSARDRGGISAGLMGSMRPKGREGGGKKAAAAQNGLGLAAPGAGGSSQTFFCGLPAFGGFEREALGAIGDLGFGFGGLAPP